eukprot:scaffold880_cov132-Cylindrotheca_fusiformis.AAC.21
MIRSWNDHCGSPEGNRPNLKIQNTGCPLSKRGNYEAHSRMAVTWNAMAASHPRRSIFKNCVSSGFKRRTNQ